MNIGQATSIQSILRTGAFATVPPQIGSGWILELDITDYFDLIVREQLMELIEKRVSDSSVLRLIREWIQVGVIDQGQLLVSDKGTG